MNAHECKVRSIGDASVEKVEVGVFPDEIEYGCPDDCFEDVKNNRFKREEKNSTKDNFFFEYNWLDEN